MRPLLPSLAFVVLFGVVGIFAFVGEDPSGPEARRQRGMDLIHYWVAGTLLDGGEAAQLYDSRAYRPEYKRLHPIRPPRYPVGYPPPIYQLFSLPQPAISYLTGAKLLLAGFAALHALGAALFVAAARLPTSIRPTAFALAVALPGAISSVMSGQLGGLWVLALGGGWWLRGLGRPVAAGVVLGLLFMKPTLALPVGLAFLLLGELRLLGGLLLGGAGVLALSLAAPDGPVAWSAYFGRLSDPADLVGDFWIHWYRQGTLRNLAAGLAGARSTWAAPLGGLGMAVGLAGAVALAWRNRRGANPELVAPAVLSWCLLAAPHLLEYDLGLHLPALLASAVWLASGRALHPRVGAVLLAAAWAAGALVLLSKGSRVNLTALALGLWAAWLAVEVFACSVPRGPSQGRGT
jgi:hypothetical protein